MPFTSTEKTNFLGLFTNKKNIFNIVMEKY